MTTRLLLELMGGWHHSPERLVVVSAGRISSRPAVVLRSAASASISEPPRCGNVSEAQVFPPNLPTSEETSLGTPRNSAMSGRCEQCVPGTTGGRTASY